MCVLSPPPSKPPGVRVGSSINFSAAFSQHKPVHSAASPTQCKTFCWCQTGLYKEWGEAGFPGCVTLLRRARHPPQPPGPRAGRVPRSSLRARASSPLCGTLVFLQSSNRDAKHIDSELMRCRLAGESVSQLSDREINRSDLNVFFNLM